MGDDIDTFFEEFDSPLFRYGTYLARRDIKKAFGTKSLNREKKIRFKLFMSGKMNRKRFKARKFKREKLSYQHKWM